MDSILDKWYESKEKLSRLEKKIEKYKKSIIKEMDKQKVNTLSTSKYKITRRKNTRTYLSKDSVPENIWKEYSTRSNYDSFFLTKIRS